MKRRGVDGRVGGRIDGDGLGRLHIDARKHDDRLEAQVHVLISTQSTGGGGTEYTLTFIGQIDTSLSMFKTDFGQPPQKSGGGNTNDPPGQPTITIVELPPEWKAAYEAGLFTEFMEQRAPGHTVLDDKIYTRGMLDFKQEIYADTTELLATRRTLDTFTECSHSYQNTRRSILQRKRIPYVGKSTWIYRGHYN